MIKQQERISVYNIDIDGLTECFKTMISKEYGYIDNNSTLYITPNVVTVRDAVDDRLDYEKFVGIQVKVVEKGDK